MKPAWVSAWERAAVARTLLKYFDPKGTNGALQAYAARLVAEAPLKPKHPWEA